MKIVIYTHSEYDWLWKICIGQTQKYFSDWDRVVFVDQDKDNAWSNAGYKVITYKNEDNYKTRVISCLERLDPNEVINYFHEDMFMYDKPDYDKLKAFHELVLTDKAQVIKFIRSGNFLVKSQLHENLYLNPPNLKYAIQPSFIKVGKLLEIFRDCQGFHLWSFESTMFNTPHIGPMHTFFIYNGEKKIGTDHYDSNIYPYVATASVRGHWNMSEYGEKLTQLFQEYSIDPTPHL